MTTMSVSQVRKENTTSTKVAENSHDHHGHKHIHVSSQIQIGQEQGIDCGAGDGGGSVYSKYRSSARNYHNGPYIYFNKQILL